MVSFVSTAGGGPTTRRAPAPLALPSTVIAVLALAAAGAVLRFAELGHQGLWYDESYTELLVRYPPGKMLGLIPHTESTPPLYYCLAWVWVRVFGFGPAGLRSLSAVAGVTVIPLAYGAAAELTGSRRAGIACAALAAFNPLLWWYSQEARSYELLCALSALSLLAFARARTTPSPGRVTAWVLAAALAMATHYFAALLVVPEALVLLFAAPRRRSVQVGVAVAGLCGVALVPLAISQNGTGNDSWIGHSPLGIRLAQILPQLLIGTGAPDRTIVKLIAFALGAVALGLLVAASWEARRGALVAGGLALIGFAIALVLIPVGFDDLITRNLIELWVPVAVLAAAGLTAARAPRLGAATCAGLCAVGLFCIVGVLSTPRLQRPEWPALVRAIGRTPPPSGGSRAIVIQRYGTLLPLSVDMSGLHILRGRVRVSELDVIAMHSPGQPLCWWGAQCNLISSTLQRRYGLAGLHVAGALRVSQFRVRVLRAPPGHPALLDREEVARALQTTHIAHDVVIIQRPSA